MRAVLAVLMLCMAVPVAAQQRKPHGPETQAAFVAMVTAHRDEYKSAAGDLRKSLVVTKARKAEEEWIGGVGNIEGWTGKIVDLGTTSEGLAHVVIEIAPDIRIKTWSNAFSDLQDKTLIRQDSAVFTALADMKKRQMVKLSAWLIRDTKGGIREASVTERGRMTEPEFIAQIRALAPAP